MKEAKEKVLSKEQQKSIHTIYDRIFKKIMTLSKKAVIHLINGLYDTHYLPESVVTYPGTEGINNGLSLTMADVFVTINNIHTYHMEAQMTEDASILFRVFDYNYAYAERNKENNCLYFPEPKIIFLYSEKDIPKEYSLFLEFGNQGRMEYKIGTFNFIKTTTEELIDKKMILLMPFQLLKVRKMVEEGQEPDLPEKLKKLLMYDIVKPIEDSYKMGYIELADAELLKSLTKKLYHHLYAHYEEMKVGGVNDMVDDILELECEKVLEELQKQADVYKASIMADVYKKQAEVEKDKAEVEKDKAEVEKDKAEVEKDKAEVEKDKAEVEKDKAEVEKDKAEIQKKENALRKMVMQCNKMGMSYEELGKLTLLSEEELQKILQMEDAVID